MKLVTRFKRWLTFSAIVGTLVLGTAACSHSADGADTHFPRDAFAYFQVDAEPVVVQACKEREIDGKSECVMMPVPPLHSAASGIVIANSKRYSNRQYVMTAGHVCETNKWYEKRVKAWAAEDDILITEFFYAPRMTITNNTGHRYPAKVVALYPSKDLCIVAVENTGVKPMKLARRQVKPGAHIWNLAAPLGIWQPNLQNKFHGSYSGEYICMEDESHTFAIPCKAGKPAWSVFALPATHGSSGSPIFDRNGHVIGIISMVPEGFPELAYAVRLEDMHRLLDALLKHEREIKKSYEIIDLGKPGMNVDDVVLIEG